MTPEPHDEWLGGWLGLWLGKFVRRAEPKCAICGRPVRAGEPHAVDESGRIQHIACLEEVSAHARFGQP